MKFSKPPLSIKEQIKKIKSKGIIIKNEKYCKCFLKKNNYQKLLSYRILVNSFEIKYLEDIIEFYKFDIQLRNLYLYILSIIENKIKTELAYYSVTRHGNHAYLNDTNFKVKKYHSFFVRSFSKKACQSKSLMIKNHFLKYCDDPPFYKAVEILSFGEISKLYSNLTLNVKKEFTNKNYVRLDIKTLTSWLRTLVDLRNECAHGQPLLINNLIFPHGKLRNEIWDKYDFLNLVSNFKFSEEIEKILGVPESYKTDLNQRIE